jgi:hypothetical protein
MISFSVLLACGAADSSLLSREVLKEYGKKDGSTIDVAVTGVGVQKPGVFHVPVKSTLLHVVTLAGAPPTQRRRLKVIQSLHSGVRIHEFTFDRSSNPPLPAFTLGGGDSVLFLAAER